eukprot:jgi/Orpsp1_1/1175694/evm.model.c7180000054863.1
MQFQRNKNISLVEKNETIDNNSKALSSADNRRIEINNNDDYIMNKTNFNSVGKRTMGKSIENSQGNFNLQKQNKNLAMDEYKKNCDLSLNEFDVSSSRNFNNEYKLNSNTSNTSNNNNNINFNSIYNENIFDDILHKLNHLNPISNKTFSKFNVDNNANENK